MFFWITISLILGFIAWLASVDYRNYPRKPKDKIIIKARRDAMIGSVLSGLFFGGFGGAILLSFVFIFGFIIQDPVPTVVSETEIALVPVGQTDVRVLSGGVGHTDKVTFRMANDLNATVKLNSEVEIVAGSGNPSVLKVDTHTFMDWLAPFPVNFGTKYVLRVQPDQIAGAHLLTVR